MYNLLFQSNLATDSERWNKLEVIQFIMILSDKDNLLMKLYKWDMGYGEIIWDMGYGG